jgi:hypothetical protein
MIETRRMTAKDTVKVMKYLEKIDNVIELPSRNDMKEYIRLGFGIIAQDKISRKIKGVILTYQTAERNVIAFFHIDEDLRQKPIVRDMFKAVVKNFDKNLPTHIMASDISTFEKRVRHIEDDLYEWIGDTSLWEK